MGLASKRRGGSGGGSGGPGGGGNSRTSKGSSGRIKEKGFKGDDADGKISRNGAARSRLNRRSTSPTPDSSRRRRNVDPAKLARGMSSRLVGARVSQQLSILTPDEIERDLRHMEAYENACTAYAQQFFIFQNRALVQSGHFGPISAPGLASDNYVASGGAVEGYGYQPHNGGYEGGPYGAQRPEASPRTRRAGSQFAMPVRIDPEEEKRVAMLRKRIAASEAQREVLETEYISLRAHYVNESQRLLRTRHNSDGQVKMLQELIQKRGDVLALKRVRCAVARDILSSLERRTRLLESQEGVSTSVTPLDTKEREIPEDPQPMDGVAHTEVENGKPGGTAKELADILDVWNSIEEQLRDAEQACIKSVTTPTLPESKSSRQKKSENGPSKKKAGFGEKKKDSTADGSEDDPVVLWESQTMPRAPYGVPLLLSYLSSVPDKAAGFACGGMFGSKKHTMCWLEANIPESFEDMGSEREDMLRLREESQFLTQELDKERETNKELQREVISGRKRSDEMCSMMTMLRSETEAVLQRHNVLLYTPEARAASEAVHSQDVDDLEHNDEYDEEIYHGSDAGQEGEYSSKRQSHALSPVREGDRGGIRDLNDHRNQELNHDSGQLRDDDNVNDGDDEGEIDEDDEEDGEILEDDRQKPPVEVYVGGEDGHHNDISLEWRRPGEELGRKRGISEREGENGGESSPHGSFGSGKRRRRM